MKKYSLLLTIALVIVACKKPTEPDPYGTPGPNRLERIEGFQSHYVPTRNIDVWLPDNYTNQKTYATLYMHDGQMIFDSAYAWAGQEWEVDETAQRLINEGKIREVIIIGIWSNEYRHSEYFPQKPFQNLPQALQDSLMQVMRDKPDSSLFKAEVYSDNYLKFIVDELKPYIDVRYTTKSDPANTFIAGSSMGGLISMYALCEYPHVFGGAACMSTHWLGTLDTSAQNPIPRTFADYLYSHLPPPSTHKLYFDYGTQSLDAYYDPHQKRIDSVMTQRQYTSDQWVTLKFAGESHNANSWKKRVHVPLSFLLQK